MTNRARLIFYLTLLFVFVAILYLAGETLSPFVFAAVFAYLLNPLVSFLTRRFFLPRTLAIIVVYLGILFLLSTTGIYLGKQLLTETQDFARDARGVISDLETGNSTKNIPGWLAPYLLEGISSLRNSINFSSQQAVKVLSGTISSITSVFVFLIALFYFLKDGEVFLGSLRNSVPENIKKESIAVLVKVRAVLNNYLRAQLLLVGLMAIVGTILFSILEVRYALMLGIIIGLAEIIPIIGPIFALISVIFISSIGGGIGATYFDPFLEIPMAGLIYVSLNQVENILIVPQITGRMVELHPLLILASVLIGGQLFGAAGFLLAVPTVASGKVVLNHLNNLIK